MFQFYKIRSIEITVSAVPPTNTFNQVAASATPMLITNSDYEVQPDISTTVTGLERILQTQNFKTVNLAYGNWSTVCYPRVDTPIYTGSTSSSISFGESKPFPVIKSDRSVLGITGYSIGVPLDPNGVASNFSCNVSFTYEVLYDCYSPK
jgi:hypothetical protein